MDLLRIAAVVEGTHSEGPGARMAIWVQGCTIRCPGCCNPEMLPMDGGTLVAAAELARRVETARGIEGITLLGGEPFHQAAGLARVAAAARARGLSVLVFSGFVLEELRSTAAAQPLLELTDVLVAGRYERERHCAARPGVGSSNQRVHHLTGRYRDHPHFQESHIQSVTIRIRDGELEVSGWPAMADALRPRKEEV